MKVIWVGLCSSALAVAAIVAYGFLFGVQSRPDKPVTWAEILYIPLIALLGGALAALLLLLRSGRRRFTPRDGAALGLSAGTATGVFLLVWQLLFAGIVNVLLQHSGLFFIASAQPHPLNPTQLYIGSVFVLLFTSLYSLAEGVAAVVGGALAGGIAGFLSRAYATQGKPSA